VLENKVTCYAVRLTLTNRKDVDFSIPIFPVDRRSLGKLLPSG
jgi:hypothetical protein